MQNDANFIEIGHEYELFYYNMSWKSLGRTVAGCEPVSGGAMSEV
jgi:hypothetical protein